MSNCPLTFKQIQIIKETFLNIQVGVYHSRVEYPDDKKKEKQGKEKDKPDLIDEPNIPRNT
jgi:hypothetical protein